MRKVRMILSGILLAAVMLSGCSNWSNAPEENRKLPVSILELPDEYEFARPFVDTLAERNVNVLEVNRSVLETFFQDGNVYPAVWIKTDPGVVELIHLPNGVAEDMNIEAIPHGEPGRYQYRINGQLFDSPQPVYFLQTDQYLGLTKSRELYDLIRDLE
ncbi:MAG: hypothetical protein H0Z33_06820 [Bacillaceae bacterium]|nr:hypothetical protein [Bacillaceae bacterium]